MNAHLINRPTVVALPKADRDGDGEIGEADFYRVMKHKKTIPLDVSSDEDDY